VATIRSALRYALYAAPTLSQAIDAVNGTVAAHKMLYGFATLFVGCYNASSRALTYVNCGQEPGVLVRANGRSLETLRPTGPVFGLAETATFAQAMVQLSPGDLFAVFTDGLTEIGPSRAAMLDYDGFASIVAARSQAGPARLILNQVMDDVTEFSRGIVRDDQCLIVAVVTS
jgi:sigma-B regulation protein RsbU (phosphoserine phosphatase)